MQASKLLADSLLLPPHGGTFSTCGALFACCWVLFVLVCFGFFAVGAIVVLDSARTAGGGGNVT